MKRIVCFGEILMRLSPPGYRRFVQASSFDVSWSGAEANVAVMLASLGLEAVFVSRVPANEIGQAAINALRRYGVDTTNILRGGERLGIYFAEKGASQRPSKVIYDRANSGISEPVSEFDWEGALGKSDALHITGITPALSDFCARETKRAMETAKRLGLMVSFDLNYRKKLWDAKKAASVLGSLLPLADICIANEEDPQLLFDISAKKTNIERGEIDPESHARAARELCERFGVKKTAITLRGSVSASDNTWSGLLYDSTDGRVYQAPVYNVRIIDRIGGGDAFAAGLIFSLLSGRGCQDALNFAAAAGCLKHSIEEDFCHVSAAEVEALAGGSASGRVQR